MCAIRAMWVFCGIEQMRFETLFAQIVLAMIALDRLSELRGKVLATNRTHDYWHTGIGCFYTLSIFST